MKIFLYIVLWVAMATVLIWCTARITLYQYKATCEPLMSQDQTQTWLECDSQPHIPGTPTNY